MSASVVVGAPAVPSWRGGEPQPDLAIDRVLALGDRLLAAALGWAAQLDLEAIDLPPVLGSEPDQARLRALAPLYLAAELESARLVPAVETLAAMLVTGALRAELGTAAPRL